MKSIRAQVQIKSLSEYLRKIEKKGFSTERGFSPRVFYRGEADSSWEQKASLFRGKSDDYDNFKDVNWSLERDLLKSAMIQYPEVFKDCPNAISRLVRMQHYTLPTRLYDVTSNPLVALYFACCTEFDKDGIVLYTKSDVGLTSLAEIDILADLVELLDESEKSVKNMFDYLRVNDRVPVCSNEQSLEKFLFKRITESLLFQPPMDNERIKRQQGAFVFSALMKPFYGFKDYRPLKRDLENKDRLSDSMKDLAFSKCREVDLRGLFEAKYFYIKSENKIQLLRELDLVGINEAYVYPEVEHRMKTIKFKNLPKNSEMLI